MKKLFFIIGLWIIPGVAIQSVAQPIEVNQTFQSDTVFRPFTGSDPIYSLKFTGDIQLLSDSSLVRIILIDDRSMHYLVYEAYPLITTSTNISLDNVCDETCYLDGIVPDSIRIDIVNAEAKVTSLTVETTQPSITPEVQRQAKWSIDSAKIAIMNSRIQTFGMYWHAGPQNMTSMSFMQKENHFGKKFNIAGFDYYDGGVFEFLYRRAHAPGSGSLMVDEFDWRLRHDASVVTSHYYNPSEDGWITTPESQGSTCNSCFVFSTVHAFADLMNVYTNRLFNYDLSEEEALVCSKSSGIGLPCGDCQTGGNPDCVLTYLSNYGIHKDTICKGYLYQPNPICDSVCPYDTVYKFSNHFAITINEDSLRTALIKYGPLSGGLNDSIFNFQGGHVMELIGYKAIHAGDTVYTHQNTWITIPDTSGLIGQVSWIFKNSLDPTHYFRFCGDLNTFLSTYYLVGPVRKVIGSAVTLIKPVCKDEDGDGYYWWGVGPLTQDCGCPPGVTSEMEDCNDNDPLRGPYITTVNNPDSLPLYSCAPNKCVTLNATIDINNDTIWTGIKHINKNIIVHAQRTLTVKGQLFFSPGARIIVQSQGLLVIHGDSINSPARLSSGCGQMWGGVELLGDPIQSQDSLPNQNYAQSQGTIIIYNGIIENAQCGIKTFNTNAIQQKSNGGYELVGFPSGGIIKAELATFKNNKTGVEFYPYRYGNVPNKSYFKACSFITNDFLLNNATPDYLLKLSGTNTIKVYGSSFKNKYFKNSGQLPVYGNRGSGIYCFNASLVLDSLHEVAPSLGINKVYKPEFENLNYGIYAFTSGTGKADIKLAKAQFNSNKHGAYFSGYREVNPLNIVRNNFALNVNFGADTLYCLYLDHCSGYKVTNNSFDGSGLSSSLNTLGIIVNQSGARTNYIYNNGPFSHLTNALQGQNVNRGIYLPDGWDTLSVELETGLHFVCNDFVMCKNDMVINQNSWGDHNGIDYYQRNYAGAPAVQQPAGNTFTYDLNLVTDHKDIDNDQNVGSIQYSYHNSCPSGTRVNPQSALITNPERVFPNPMNVPPFYKSFSCPDSWYPPLDRSILRNGINDADNRIDSLLNLLTFLTDDGSTDSLRSMVVNGTPSQSYTIYQDLLNASPYLSDTVLNTSINKEDVLPNAMLRDIMVANPQSAKSEALLSSLDNRNNPMPDSLWADILQGKDTIGAMERLESELSGWIQMRDIYLNCLISVFLDDTANSSTGDSIVAVLQSDNSIGSRYNLLAFDLQRRNFSHAISVLENIPYEFTVNDDDQVTCEDFAILISLFGRLVDDTLGFKVPDSLQCDTLFSISLHENLPAIYARNLLIATGRSKYHEPIILETSAKESRPTHWHGHNKKSTSEIRAFPNPCNDYIILEYSNEISGAVFLAEILDSNGQILESFTLRKQYHQIVLPFSRYSPGIYFLRFSINGGKKEISRIIHN